MKKIFLGIVLAVVLTDLKSQNVGIGTTTPGFPLNFSNALGDKISLWGNSGNHYGFGVQSGLLQIHSDASFAHIGFGYGSSADFTERMRIINEGPDGLSLDGRIVLRNGTNPLNPASGSGVWMYKPDNSSLLGFMGVQNNQNLGFYGGADGWGFTYDAINSRVGIGNNTPANKLDVNGDINLTGKLKINGNSGTTGLFLKSNGADNPPTWENVKYKQVLFSTFLAGSTNPLPSYCPVSQSNTSNSSAIEGVDFVMPYSGKVVSINIRTFTISSTSGSVNTITVELYKNGTFTGSQVILDSPLPAQTAATFSNNWNVNFSAGDRLSYRVFFSITTTSVKLNSSLAVLFD